ncbi:MAG: ABC transporter ATP-binding protein [Hyphomicrobiales bacterium]
MPSIDLVNINKSFGSVDVCRDINLAISDREFVTLLGSSGCGKTTTLNMIAGLDDPTSGDILMDGRRVNGLEPVDRDVAMVFQNYALYPHMTVAGNMGFNLKLRGIPSAEIHERVIAAASALDLNHVLDRYPNQLSGGQQQRVAIGRAIVRRPKVFLFDEPFSNLDAALRNRMRAEVKELHARLGVTSIFVTHDQEEALSISDRVAIMRNGSVEQFGTPEDVYASPETIEVARFIGTPQVEILKCAIDRGDGGDAVLRCGTASFPIGPEHAIALGSKAEVLVTIRPEHVVLGSQGITATISDVQPVGPSTLVKLGWDGGAIIARLNGIVRLTPGETAHFSIDPFQLMFFDAEGGRRIKTKFNDSRLRGR